MTYPEVSKKVSIKGRNLLTVVGIWVYAFILVFPTMVGKHGSFGFDKEKGKCDFVEKDGVDPRWTLLSIGGGLPLILTTSSYLGIWRTVTKSSSGLKPYS